MKKIIFIFLILIVAYFSYYFYQQREIPLLKKRFLPAGVKNQELISITTQPTKINQNETSPQDKSQKEFFLEIDYPTNGITVNQSTITLTGKTIPGAEIFINDIQLRAKSDGLFSATINLEEGENVLIVIANDDQGNYLEKEITVNLETLE